MKLKFRAGVRALRPMILAIALASFAGAASAAMKMFLFIPGVPGEATAELHVDWIDLNSLSVGVANGTCSGLVVSKNLDKSSPLLSGAALAGSTYPTMTVDVARATEGATSVFLTYSLANVTVSSVSQSTSLAAPSVSENVTFAATTVTMTYRPQRADGTLGAPLSFTLACSKK